MNDDQLEPPDGGESAEDQKPTRDPVGTAGTAPAPPDPRTTIAGRYAVDLASPGATTGIAVAHLGRDLRTRDAVVVKTLRLEYRGDPEMRARFRREARLLQFLTHPNVIRALTFTEERGAPWLVLERVPGRSLREEIESQAPLSPEKAVPLLNGIAAALDHLHARGLVHLDVRPENIVVTQDGGVKLIDFGLAQTAGTLQESSHNTAPGSIAYLAPEQLRGEPVSVGTDVFALGCVAYEMLTGRPPFAEATSPANRNAAIRAHLEERPAPPTTVKSGVALPAWIDGVVLEALERNPRQRYGSAGTFAAVFHSGVEGDVDVETGRPRLPEIAPRPRTVPINEPGIAMKGSPRLAARRAGTAPDDDGSGAVEATYSPLPPVNPVSYAIPARERLRSLDVARLSRRLWLAVIVAAALNLLLMGLLVATRGELPGIWQGTREIGPGVTVRIAGTGLVARAEPDQGAEIVADLPEGGAVRISGEPVPGDDGLWWPVEVETPEGVARGYVPESWVQAP